MTFRSVLDAPIRKIPAGTRKWGELKDMFGRDDLAPHWIADMEFQAAEPIRQALSEAVAEGMFGYPNLVRQCRQAVADWLTRRHHFTAAPDNICFMPRVVGGIALAVNCFTRPGDGIVVQTPVYAPLQNVIEASDRKLYRNPLRLERGRYTMDYGQLESLFAQGARMLLLCSPHNPTGRVWSAEELRELTALCLRYDVLVLSDEIHQDLIYSDASHTMLASVSPAMAERVVTFIAPTKTFNIAGLMASAAVLPAALLQEYSKTLKRFDIQVNQLGQLALCAAYRNADEWLRELLAYLEDNRAAAEERLQRASPAISMIRPEGTYLYWLDVRGSGCSADEIMARLVHQARVAVYDGRRFGHEGAGFVRFNAACPRSVLLESLERICRVFPH